MDLLAYYKAHFASALALRRAIAEYLYGKDDLRGDRSRLLKALQDAEKVGEEAMR